MSAPLQSPAPFDPLADDDFSRLLGQVRAGEKGAANTLFERFGQYLLAVAETETDRRLRAKQGFSDLVQETLLDAHVSMAGFRGSTPQELARWLRRILHNNAIDFARRYRRAEMREAAREVPLLPGDERRAAFATADETPSRCVVRRECDAELQRALAALPEHYRQAIEFRYRDRLTFVRMGARMNLSGEAARKLWWRAVRALKQLLVSDDDA